MNWFRKKEDEEHNFFQNYTDLLSGFLIVFIIASLAFSYQYIRLQGLVDRYGKDASGLSQDLELVEKLSSFAQAQNELTKNNKYIFYNKEADRFECEIKSIFEPYKSMLQSDAEMQVIDAGQELKTILSNCKSDNIEFKLIIEGRASRYMCKLPSVGIQDTLQKVSEDRAKYLYQVWKESGALTELTNLEKDVIVIGSGVYGYNRYHGVAKEDLNRRVVIQIIPYIKFKD